MALSSSRCFLVISRSRRWPEEVWTTLTFRIWARTSATVKRLRRSALRSLFSKA